MSAVDPPASKSVDRTCAGCGRGRPTLTLAEFPALLLEGVEVGSTVEAKGAAEALSVNALVRLSNESPPEEEGGTARIVDFSKDGSSSSTSRPDSKSSNSGGGDDGAVLPCENLRDEGEKDDEMKVSSSEMLVEAECLKPFFRDRIGCGASARVASNLAIVLATWLPLETRDPGLSGLSNP